MVSMGMSAGMTQRQDMRHTMTLGQRQHLVASMTLTVRLNLIAALHGHDSTSSYRPEATCPTCDRKLQPVEILKGFNNDPTDYTTACTGCGLRFNPKLVWVDVASRIELGFYCDLQTQHQLAPFATMAPDEFRQRNPTLYHSAIVHNGTLRHAFERLQITYTHVEVRDPKDRILPFLGELPDTVIAEISGVGVKTIRRLRKKHGIEAYSQQAMLEAADDN